MTLSSTLQLENQIVVALSRPDIASALEQISGEFVAYRMHNYFESRVYLRFYSADNEISNFEFSISDFDIENLSLNDLSNRLLKSICYAAAYSAVRHDTKLPTTEEMLPPEWKVLIPILKNDISTKTI